MKSLKHRLNDIEAKAEADLEAVYGKALEGNLRKKEWRVIRDMLDGKIKPPRRFVTEPEKANWRKAQAARLAKEGRLEAELLQAEMTAGEKAVGIIQDMSARLYNEVYQDTLRRLRG